MRVLALEPYYGGSHKAFLTGWMGLSRHQWDVQGLPPNKWKWRMRHAALTFSEELARQVESGRRWDVLLCSDMLNLAEFRGLAPPSVARLPAVVYFHENQLTYPVRQSDERDYSYVMINLTSALSAQSVWFNSDYHRQDFLGQLPAFLRRMPDNQSLEAVERVRNTAIVRHPGIDEFPQRQPRPWGPIRILWAARWEHDKNPDVFFAALKQLKWRGVDFRLSVVGEQFRDAPAVFEEARQYFYYHIDRWGFQPTRRQYEDALAESDVIVSTAGHEFFGIGVVEAVAAGCFPLVPTRLSYPEILGPVDGPNADFFYDGTAEQLTERLAAAAEFIRQGILWQHNPERGIKAVARYSWETVAPQLDQSLELVAEGKDPKDYRPKLARR